MSTAWRALAVFLATILLSVAAPAVQAAAPSSQRVVNAAQFDSMARVLPGGRFARVPQMMFVLDRAQKGPDGRPRLYFVNSRRFEFHIDFVHRTYLSAETTERLLQTSYLEDDRRFVFGSIVRYPRVGRYVVEFWEGDTLDRSILRQAMDALKPAFFAPLAFKPNSQRQYDLAASAPDVPSIDGGSVMEAADSLILNAGKAVGRLRFADRAAAESTLVKGDIVVLDEAPLTLSPVAGIVSTAFSTPLSHVNLLAKTWRIPNVYLRGARQTYAALDGRMVALEAKGAVVTLRAATPAEIAAALRQASTRAVRLPQADLTYRDLPALTDQRAADSVRTGAKAANLGEVARRAAGRKDAGFQVPPGFSIPFAYYADFVHANGVDRRIDALLGDPAVRTDPKRRREALADLRQAFSTGTFDPALLQRLQSRRAEVIGAGGVFARSSTNSEDLQGFNGAGLYSSVPNVVTQAQLADAVRTVWGSVWNDRAFEAREAAGIDHRGVRAAVLVQLGMDASAAGVMVTENPFDPAEAGAIFINAKRGLGIRVVEGRRVAEQLIYRNYPEETVQVLTRSADDAMLSFDAAGGVKEIAVEPGRAVLTDEAARRLARAGRMIESWFGGRTQDIEWLTLGDRLYIVQARPYYRGD